jgi:hypothetical protein
MQAHDSPNQTVGQNLGPIGSASSNFDLLFIVRLVFYIMVILKLVEVVYFRKRKMNLRERIYRKFLFAHNEVLRTFT